ncbi:MAG: glycosyltransferase family 2 protein [Acidobacteria bacterium]|nr:glycosyltransferase family 2 protein [Acidobacteriota bacterium]
MISVTIPVFNEADNLRAVFDELVTVLKSLNQPYEILFINDGSSDASESVLDTIAEENERVKVIHFRRNYGQTAAMMAGFDFANGDIIIPMDGDGQNDPADIPALLEKLDTGYDLCSGWRKHRRDPLSKRVLSRMANWLISKVCKVELHDFGCTLKAYRKESVEGIKLYGEMHRFLPIHAAWQGARICERIVNHRPRTRGKSNYGFERTLKVFLDLMVVGFIDRFFSKPIYLFGTIGLLNFLISTGAFTASVWYKIWGNKSFIETPLPLLGAMTFLTGSIFILMGILAELMIRTYFESQDKATYRVSRVAESSPPKIGVVSQTR